MGFIEYRAAGWWYWLATVSFLTVRLAGWTEGYWLALGAAVLNSLHFVLRERSLTAFPVQVRFGFLLLLLLALPEETQWLRWLLAAGTWVRVLSGYCALARILSLLPWNRKEALSLDLLKRTFLSAPVPGNILREMPMR